MTLADDAKGDGILTVRVPIALLKRGGRKVVLAPEGAMRIARPRRIDNAMVKAFARAFRWRKLIETGAYPTVSEIAKAEGVNDSYVGRVLRLALLAPDIVEAMVDGRQPPEIALRALLRPFSVDWDRQRAEFRCQ
jgi:hypothetical protein